VLEELGRSLASTVREVDSVGRLYGEKFLIIARETGEEGAARLAERIRGTVAGSRFRCNDQVIPITLSIGFAVAEAGVHPDLEAMTEVASAALARARRAGRNRCEVVRLPAAPVKNGEDPYERD
jgi:diguanylate cyclase (GGDEF)-like protein